VRIVLDTNVLVSGLLNPYGPPGRIVEAVAVGDLVLCYDARILLEYEDVLLRPKFRLNPRRVSPLLESITTFGEEFAGKPLRIGLPDVDDEPFLEVAIAGGVDGLVTGNQKHFPSRACEGIPIVDPAAFLRQVNTRKK
jgi:putative PIN family toxin of toxin-antitoxin system